MIRSARTRSLARRALTVLGMVLAAYLVVRGVVELVTIDYGDPDSYRSDWGGPSLAGVLAVHAGPGILVVAGTAVHHGRRRSRRRTSRP